MGERDTGHKKPVEVTTWPGSASLADIAPSGWYTRKKAAALVGRNPDTLKRWMNDGTYEPGGFIQRGKLTIWLWSDDDIEAMREIAGTKKAGRPPGIINNNESEDEHATDSGAPHV